MAAGEQEITFKRVFVPLTAKKVIGFIVVIGLIVYFNCLFNGFVIDDLGQVVYNPDIRSLANIPAFFFNQRTLVMLSNYYRPVPVSLYTILFSVFGTNAFPYHILQLSIHLANTILVFLMLRIFIKKPAAILASLLFLVHPINEETVVYIADLQDVLFVFFGLLALFFLQIKPEKVKYIVLFSILLFFSLLAKETGILFLMVSLLYVYLFRRKILKLFLICSSSAGLVYLFLRLLSGVPWQKDPLVPIMVLPFWQRMINVPGIIFYYFRILVYPDHLAVLHSWVVRDIQIYSFFLPLIIDILPVLFLTILSVRVFKKRRELRAGILFFGGWFTVGSLPYLQIIPVDTTVADRYFYFPVIGLLGILGILASEFRLKRPVKLIAVTGVCILLVIFSIRTMVRNTDWRDATTLLTHDQQIAHGDYLQELSYGLDLVGRGKYDEAFPHIQEALRSYPQSWKAWDATGALYYQKGDMAKAKTAFLQTIAIRKYEPAYEDAGLIFMKEKPLSNEGLQFIRKATDRYPKSEKLWFYRLIAEYRQNNYDNALLAARNYYLLKRDGQSYAIYTRMQNKQPLKIEI